MVSTYSFSFGLGNSSRIFAMTEVFVSIKTRSTFTVALQLVSLGIHEPLFSLRFIINLQRPGKTSLRVAVGNSSAECTCSVPDFSSIAPIFPFSF